MTGGSATPTRWVGIDVGGTFTDLVLYDEVSGALVIEKVPSTPQDHSEGMANGVAKLGVALADVGKIAHGTTVATNTILERSGANVALVTTRGFRDVLEVGKGNRTQLYNIKGTKPPRLLRRSLCFEVDERTLADGTVLRAVDEAEVRGIARQARAQGAEAIIVCFLHSYANAANELAAERVIGQELPEIFVSASSNILPQFREFERFAATAVNAFVAPRMKRYLTALERRLSEIGYSRPITVMVSNGGTLPIERVVRVPIQTMLSGPAAGVIGASYVAEIAGERNLITYDMGGTSTDVCLVKDYRYQMTTDGQIADLPNPTLQIEINSVGAGGGSVATIGAGGFLTVGPRSAGARPGPACYGHGGTESTVTDANVALGRLGVDRPLGGVIALDRGRAIEAVAALARNLGVGVEQMAEGIINLAVVKMTGAIKEVSVMRGFDPRDFALFAYGGAGPLHAALVADELGIRKVIVPPMPGNFSAFGLLVADVRYDVVRTRVTPLQGSTKEDLAATLAEIRSEAAQRLAQDGFAPERRRYEIRLDMRYVGQAYEIPVDIPADWASVDDIANAFRAAYERRYAYSSERPAEIINWRVSGYGLLDKPKLSRVARRTAGASLASESATRSVVFNGKAEDCAVLYRDDLTAQRAITGPAIIEEYGSTTVVPPGFRAEQDDRGLLILQRA